MEGREPIGEDVEQWATDLGRDEPAPPEPADDEEAIGEQTSEWVITPPSSVRAEDEPTAKAKAKPKPKPKPKAKAKPKPKAKPRVEPAADREIAELRARIAELEGTLASVTARAETAERQAAEAERRALEAASAGPGFAERASEVEERVSQAERRISGATLGMRKLAARTGTDRPDINAIGYEELRELGLSVTESARLLAVRDVRGGFRSLDELDDVRDFPTERLTELKSRLRV
jgi:DNA uptake protein ComE-like DNA-binding protein